MNIDRFWRRLPPLVQFVVLCVFLPGVVVHEYVHAVTGLLEGADSVTFDWGRASVDLDWSDETTGRWTWIAPTIVAVAATPAITAYVATSWTAPIAALAYLWVQLVLLAYPSPNDIERYRVARASA